MLDATLLCANQHGPSPIRSEAQSTVTVPGMMILTIVYAALLGRLISIHQLACPHGWYRMTTL